MRQRAMWAFVAAALSIGVPARAQTSSSSAQPLTLSTAMNRGLLYSPRSATARAQLPVARAAYLQASVMPNPSFIYLQNFKADKVREIGVQLPVEPPWKMAFRMLAVKRQVAQTDIEVGQTLWNLRADLRRAFVDFVIAQQLQQLQTQLLQTFRALLEASEGRYEAGGIPLVEVEKARLALEQAQVEQERQLQKVVLAQQHLNILMGSSWDVPLSTMALSENGNQTGVLPDFSKEPRPLPELISMAQQTAPALKLIAQSIKVNKANLAVAYGNVVPNPVLSFGHITAIDIGPGTSTASSTSANDTAGGANGGSNVTRGYFVGVNMDVPVFDFQQGNIARLSATGKQLKAEQLAQLNILTDQVAGAYRRLIIARSVCRSYHDRVLLTAQRVLRMNEESYKFGRSDITTALVGAQLNLQAQTQYLTAISDYQQAVTDLEQAVGQPLD